MVNRDLIPLYNINEYVITTPYFLNGRIAKIFQTDDNRIRYQFTSGQLVYEKEIICALNIPMSMEEKRAEYTKLQKKTIDEIISLVKYFYTEVEDNEKPMTLYENGVWKTEIESTSKTYIFDMPYTIYANADYGVNNFESNTIHVVETNLYTEIFLINKDGKAKLLSLLKSCNGEPMELLLYELIVLTLEHSHDNK